MQKLLNEITTSPGVMGSCVYSTKRGILASNLPTVFRSDTQEQIGSLLHQILKLNAAVKLSVNAYEVQYDEALILVKHLCDASSFVVICEPDTNPQPVNMAISVLSAQLMPLVKECLEPIDVKIVINDLLADEMTLIKKALAKCIGPIATITLEEEVETWLESGAPERERLAELTQSLLREIDDETAQKQFLDDLTSIL